MTNIKIFTDGSCLGNPGNGGWAFAVVVDGKVIDSQSGGCKDTTNNIMEMCAVIQAFSWLGELPFNREWQTETIHVWTDSQYVKRGVEEWIQKWMKNGWITAKGQPVKNQSFWKTLWSSVAVFDVKWHWVKAHNGNAMNELVDGLARTAAEGV